jgi:hypothetical protein
LKHNHQKESSPGRPKGKAKEPKRQTAHRNQKKGREIVPLVVGSYQKYSVPEKLLQRVEMKSPQD